MKNNTSQLIEMAREYERKLMETEQIQKEIDQLDDELDEIIAKTRALFDEKEDDEKMRKVRVLFEEYVRCCQEKGIVRK